MTPQELSVGAINYDPSVIKYTTNGHMQYWYWNNIQSAINDKF